MINFDLWLDSTDDLIETPAEDEAARAVAAWRRINDKPTSITVIRVGTAQTVRLEYDTAAGERGGEAGTAGVRGLIVFGVRNYPGGTPANTNIRRNDRFIYGSEEYQVIDVMETLGEIQAHAEVIS